MRGGFVESLRLDETLGRKTACNHSALESFQGGIDHYHCGIHRGLPLVGAGTRLKGSVIMGDDGEKSDLELIRLSPEHQKKYHILFHGTEVAR